MWYLSLLICLYRGFQYEAAARVSVKVSDYRVHFWYMSKDDATNIIENSNLNN